MQAYPMLHVGYSENIIMSGAGVTTQSVKRLLCKNMNQSMTPQNPHKGPHVQEHVWVISVLET